MQKLTFIKPCIIMGINQNNIARNETNYIIEKFFLIGNLLLIRSKYLLCNNSKIFVYISSISYTNSYLTIVYIRKA